MYKNIDDLPITFGPAEVAEVLGLSKNKTYELIRRPDFPKYRIGRKIIIGRKQFIAWMDAHLSDTNAAK